MHISLNLDTEQVDLIVAQKLFEDFKVHMEHAKGLIYSIAKYTDAVFTGPEKEVDYNLKTVDNLIVELSETLDNLDAVRVVHAYYDEVGNKLHDEGIFDALSALAEVVGKEGVTKFLQAL